MKKLFLYILAMVMVLSMAACSGGNSKDKSDDKKETVEETKDTKDVNTEQVEKESPETQDKDANDDENADTEEKTIAEVEDAKVKYDGEELDAIGLSSDPYQGKVDFIYAGGTGFYAFSGGKIARFVGMSFEEEGELGLEVKEVRDDKSIDMAIVVEDTAGKTVMMTGNKFENKFEIEESDSDLILYLGDTLASISLDDDKLSYTYIGNKTEGYNYKKDKLLINEDPWDKLDEDVIYSAPVKQFGKWHRNAYIVKPDGEAYSLDLTMNSSIDKERGGYVLNRLHITEPLKDVDKMYFTGSVLSYKKPIFTKMNDDKNLYADVGSITEEEIKSVGLPAGYTTKDIKDIIASDALLLITNDNKAFLLEDFKEDPEFEERPLISKLIGENKIKKIIGVGTGIYLLADDGTVYEVED